MTTTASTGRIEPSVANLLWLAWPIVVSRSTQAVVGLTDAWMVAHLGDDALAAATTGAMNAQALFILPMGVVFVVSTFASQLHGGGDPAGARRFGWYGLAVALVAGIGSVALIPLVPSAVGRMELEPGVAGAIFGYLAWRLPSAVAVVALEALGNYYGGIGNTRVPMVASVVAMVANIAFCWLLIDGNLGFAPMGVKGSALAACAGSFLAAAGLFLWFLWEGRPVGLRWDELRALVRIGLPSGLNWFFEFFAFLFFVDVVVAGLGTTSLAALMGVLQLNSVSFMPAFALASAGAIVVGQAIGAGTPDDVPLAVRRTFALAAGWQASVGIACLLVPELLFAPFVHGASTPELMTVGARMLALSAGWQLFDSAATTLAETLRAAGDTAWPLAARLVLAWGLFVPGAWISVRWLGGTEVTAMGWLIAYLGLLAAVLWLRFRSGAWRRIVLV